MTVAHDPQTYTGHDPETDTEFMLTVYGDGLYRMATRPGKDRTEDPWSRPVTLVRGADVLVAPLSAVPA